METEVSVVSKVALALLRFYRFALSPFMGGQCRFTPTCSEYARQAFSGLPAHRAFALTCWRLLRCHPWCEGGHDPAPVSGDDNDKR